MPRQRSVKATASSVSREPTPDQSFGRCSSRKARISPRNSSASWGNRGSIWLGSDEFRRALLEKRGESFAPVGGVEQVGDDGALPFDAVRDRQVGGGGPQRFRRRGNLRAAGDELARQCGGVVQQRVALAQLIDQAECVAAFPAYRVAEHQHFGGDSLRKEAG